MKRDKNRREKKDAKDEHKKIIHEIDGCTLTCFLPHNWKKNVCEIYSFFIALSSFELYPLHPNIAIWLLF